MRGSRSPRWKLHTLMSSITGSGYPVAGGGRLTDGRRDGTAARFRTFNRTS